jgi:hypothetical protein
MTHYQEIVCPDCGSNHIMKAGRSASGMQLPMRQLPECATKSFMLEYRYRAYNGSGIRDTAKVIST